MGDGFTSFDNCVTDFKNEYPNVPPPTEQAINVLIKKFRKTGSVEKKKPVRRRIRLSDDVVEDIRQRILRSPRKSVRRLSHGTGLSVGSCHTALHKSLKLYPYRVSSLRELIPADFTKRLDYCKWFQENLDDNQLDMTLFSDEAWIHLSGYLNSQNTRIWSALNPHGFVESPLHAVKIGVWMAISRRRTAY
ncbi:uncharacterized protein LOC106877993 [Octopus bimaculoides]|uniref:uncharacterized protein LOC106877993 n=1 Tax=Octopus bimaculoides TaxID=37653 RepID=UPI00071E1415|nr:uncharacterized protein LOC106877993 [Octopus bimaculoides]|eukprot:XP_014782553.1 PREDICTED: uncharacterized protein LOC106877993 [Octopus bimaculoides]